MFEAAQALQAIDALEETERGGLFSFVAPHITGPEALDAHLAEYTDLRAATVLFLGQGAVVGVTEVYLGDQGEDEQLPATSRALYAATVGRAQEAVCAMTSMEVGSEAFMGFRSFLRYAGAVPVEAAGRQLLAAHLVQANDRCRLSDVLMYPEEVGDELEQHFERALEGLHAAAAPDQREIAGLELSYELAAATRVPLLAATIMPTPGEMGELVDAYYG